jgi:RNA polymerase sigma-70 factor, ECF subfamily
MSASRQLSATAPPPRRAGAVHTKGNTGSMANGRAGAGKRRRLGFFGRNSADSDAFTPVSATLTTAGDPDVQLMLAVQRGDQGAFGQLFERYVGEIVSFAAQFVGARARAEELAQEIFLQIYRARARYVPRARFKTWLYRIATNACLSEVRRADYRGRVQPLDRAAATAEDDPPPPIDLPTRSAEDELLNREAIDRVRVVLAELPPQQRAAVMLARINGLSYEEVAASLSCSVSAVKSLIHRATLTLRDRLQTDRD